MKIHHRFALALLLAASMGHAQQRDAALDPDADAKIIADCRADPACAKRTEYHESSHEFSGGDLLTLLAIVAPIGLVIWFAKRK